MIAKRTGTSVSAIRFYADKGLLPSIRNAGGQRIFSKSVIRRVSFILISQQLGYTLTDIEIALASLPDKRTPTKADWNRLSKLFCEDIDQRMLKLQQLKDSLSGCIGCGCLSLQVCKLYNPDDKINSLGAGPRFLLGNKANDI
ncbi:UNVERIFIED_CONTAM: hypothetical protein GTU68_028236 [Idotea baltica]|nr:hypothetical protein [Idotea baltica]